MAEEVIRLKEFDSRDVLPLANRSAGTIVQRLSIVGNSFISSFFVEEIDAGASVVVNYYDFGVGGDYGERYPLTSHRTITSASSVPDRILVSNIHDKPVLEATVIGGSATFGVYITVVSANATDIDHALKYDDSVVSIGADKGMPIMIYDEIDGRSRFARGADGVQDVAIIGQVTVGDPGLPVFAESALLTSPGVEQEVLSYTVPAGYKLNLLSVQVVCRKESDFAIRGDGSLIGSGRTGAASPQVNFAYRIARVFESGKIVEVKATARAGSSSDGIECYLQGTLTGY